MDNVWTYVILVSFCLNYGQNVSARPQYDLRRTKRNTHFPGIIGYQNRDGQKKPDQNIHDTSGFVNYNRGQGNNQQEQGDYYRPDSRGSPEGAPPRPNENHQQEQGDYYRPDSRGSPEGAPPGPNENNQEEQDDYYRPDSRGSPNGPPPRPNENHQQEQGQNVSARSQYDLRRTKRNPQFPNIFGNQNRDGQRKPGQNIHDITSGFVSGLAGQVGNILDRVSAISNPSAYGFVQNQGVNFDRGQGNNREQGFDRPNENYPQEQGDYYRPDDRGSPNRPPPRPNENYQQEQGDFYRPDPPPGPPGHHHHGPPGPPPPHHHHGPPGPPPPHHHHGPPGPPPPHHHHGPPGPPPHHHHGGHHHGPPEPPPDHYHHGPPHHHHGPPPHHGHGRPPHPDDDGERPNNNSDENSSSEEDQRENNGSDKKDEKNNIFGYTDDNFPIILLEENEIRR